MDEEGYFWPVYLILVGTAILLVNVGMLPQTVKAFWPLVIIIPGLIKLSGFGKTEEKK